MSEDPTARRPLRSRELAALHEAALAITAELSLDKVLGKIVEVARELVQARYAALGVLDDDGQLAQFVTIGLTPAEVERLGGYPHGRGLLGVLLRRTRPLRVANIAAHPDSCGFPEHHPVMTTFLGAPLIARGRVMGSLYLTDKEGGGEFTPEDEAIIEMLAAQAAVAVENARLFALTDEALRQKVDELQTERRNLKAIVDQMPEGVAIVEACGECVVLFNRAALALLGLPNTPDSLEPGGKMTLRTVRGDGEPVPREETAIYRAMAKGEVVAGEQIALLRADGSQLAALANAAPLYDPEGRIVGGIVVFQDISPLKELDRLKDELISIISHELRNPLTAIRGRAQLMLRVARRTPGREEDVAGLETIDAQVEKLAEMVRELLDVSQIRLGLIELHRNPADLVPLIRQTVEQCQSGDAEHRFRLETEAAEITGNWDAQRLEQVFFNLLENAQKYSPQGGAVTVRIVERDGTAVAALADVAAEAVGHRSGREKARWVVVAISDEGIGVPKEAQRHLFDRFYRAANAKGRAETGLGLGLYICHEIVSQHGGAIWVESAENQGSTFFVALPLDS